MENVRVPAKNENTNIILSHK